MFMILKLCAAVAMAMFPLNVAVGQDATDDAATDSASDEQLFDNTEAGQPANEPAEPPVETPVEEAPVEAPVEAPADVPAESGAVTNTDTQNIANIDEITKRAQEVLGLKADGVAGPKTKAAIKAFQKKNGLATTGTLDTETIKAMNL
jgi:peptidoglycan hydrolase-like protein with peptidoglycan-binding domain